MKATSLYIILFVLSIASATTLSAQTNEASAATTSVEKKVKLKVTGINCGGDISDIQKQIASLKGVINCSPAKKPAATTSFEVIYNPALVTEKELRSAVEGTAGCSDPDSRPYKVKI